MARDEFYELICDLVIGSNILITLLFLILLMIRERQNLTNLEVLGNIIYDIVAFSIIITVSIKIHTNINKWCVRKIKSL